MTMNDRNHRNRRRRRLVAAVEACEHRRLLASVSGVIYNDADRDGVRDAGEAGRAGITVFADKNFDGAMQSTELRAVTDASGFYRISGIVADNTSTGIRIDGASLSQYDRVTAPAGGAHSARFASDYEAANRNFGIAYSGPVAGYGAVAGRVVTDSDRDGLADDGEPGIANARVYADANRNGVFDAGEASTLTNASGAYALSLPTTSDGVPYEIGATLAGSGLDPAAYGQPGTQDVSIRNGETYNGIGFAFAPRATPAPGATVTGVVYNDADRDGVRDAGEAGVADIVVYADLNGDGFRGSTEPTATTDANGAYSLSGIPLSNASIAIRATAPGGRTFTNPSNGAHSGRFGAAITYGNRNFGLTPTTMPATGYLQVLPFYDTDADGVRSEADTGSNAFTLWLDGNGNGLREASERVLTFSGYYDTAGLPIYTAGQSLSVGDPLAAGTYKVALRRPGDVDQFADYVQDVTVTAGNVAESYFLVPTTSSLGGIVYNDADGDGTRDTGESRTAGVTVFADYDFDGVRDANEPQTTTLDDGSYKLYGIRSDNNPFRVTALIAGATFTQPATGYYQARFDRAYDLAPQGGRDFGYRLSTTPAAVEPARDLRVVGNVFFDANRRGGNDTGEPGLGGIRVYYDLDGDGAFDAGEPNGTSNQLGVYEFFVPRNVPPRVIALVPGANPGYVPLFVPTDVYSSDFALASAVTNLSGIVFADANANGVRDAADGGLAGRTVFADYDFDGALDAGEPSAATDANGIYRIVGVQLNRSYTTRVVGVAAAQQTSGAGSARFVGLYDQGGRNIGVAGAGAPGVTSIVVATDPNRAGGTVYIDRDDNGRLDPGELFANVNSAGQYVLAGVTAGTTNLVRLTLAGNPDVYIAPKVVVAGSGPTTPVGSFDVESSGAILASASYDSVPLGRPVEDVWLDLNGDGVRQGGEPRLANVNRPFANGAVPYQLRVRAGTYRVAVRYAGDADLVADDARTVSTSGSTATVSFLTPFAGATIQGTAFDDTNGNGRRDAGELPRFSALVYADYNMNGRYDLGDAFVEQLAGPAENPYLIGLDANRPFVLRAYESFSAGDASRPSPTSYAFPSGLAGGARLTGYDFAVPPPAGIDTVIVTGTAYRDANGNGRRDAGEAPLSGARVFVTQSATAAPFDPTFDDAGITAADGTYSIRVEDDSTAFGNGGYLRIEGYTGAQVTQPATADGSYYLGQPFRTYVINRDFGVIV